MPVIQLLIVLVIIGVGLWLLNAYVPMDEKIKKIINIVIVVAVILYVLGAFGILDPILRLRTPNLI